LQYLPFVTARHTSKETFISSFVFNYLENCNICKTISWK